MGTAETFNRMKRKLRAAKPAENAPRIVFQIPETEYAKANRLALEDRRNSVSAYAKARFIEYLASKK